MYRQAAFPEYSRPVEKLDPSDMDTPNRQIRSAQEQQGRLADAGPFPKVVLLDTCSFCNLRCSMCVHKEMTRPKGFMPWKLSRKLVDEIAATAPATRVWMIFFGEPLVARRRKPTIFDMIAYAKGLGLTDVVMNSNANLLDEESARELQLPCRDCRDWQSARAEYIDAE